MLLLWKNMRKGRCVIMVYAGRNTPIRDPITGGVQKCARSQSNKVTERFGEVRGLGLGQKKVAKAISLDDLFNTEVRGLSSGKPSNQKRSSGVPRQVDDGFSF